MKNCCKLFIVCASIFSLMLFPKISQCQWANPIYGGFYQPLTYESPWDPYYSYQGYRYYQPQVPLYGIIPYSGYGYSGIGYPYEGPYSDPYYSYQGYRYYQPQVPSYGIIPYGGYGYSGIGYPYEGPYSDPYYSYQGYRYYQPPW